MQKKNARTRGIERRTGGGPDWRRSASRPRLRERARGPRRARRRRPVRGPRSRRVRGGQLEAGAEHSKQCCRGVQMCGRIFEWAYKIHCYQKMFLKISSLSVGGAASGGSFFFMTPFRKLRSSSVGGPTSSGSFFKNDTYFEKPTIHLLAVLPSAGRFHFCFFRRCSL